MATQVNVHEAKTHFSKLIDRVHAGEEIIIAKAGKPFAKLVGIEPSPVKRRAGNGILAGLVPPSPDEAFFEPMSDDELRSWGML